MRKPPWNPQTPLRVGWIVTPLIKEGGTFTHLRRWAEGLSGTFVRPVLFYFSPDSSFSPASSLPGVELVSLEALDLRKHRLDKAAFQLSRMVRRHQLDMLHSIYIGSDLIGLLVSRITRIPIVSTVEGALFVSTMSPAAKRAAQSAYRLLSGRFQTVMPVSHATGAALRGFLAPKVPLKTLYPGVHSHPFRPPPSLDKGLHLVTLGRLAPIKGLPLLIEALERLLPRFPSLRLTLIGDGPEREPLQALIRSRNLQHAVCITGWLDEDSVQTLLQKAHLLVLPSYSEGMPWAALEAMARGVPVVASRVGGVPELIIDEEDELCGWLVEAGKSRALTAALAHILEARDVLARLEHAGKAAHRRISMCFTARKEIETLTEVYVRIRRKT